MQVGGYLVAVNDAGLLQFAAKHDRVVDLNITSANPGG
jgi:hypothetical protein